MGTVSLSINICGDFVSKANHTISLSPELKGILDSGSVNVVNFEAPLSGYGAVTDRSGPRLCQPESAYTSLKDSGFNLFQLANNHAVDYGEEACKATKEHLHDVVGAGTIEEAYAPVIRIISGVKVGFLSFVHHEFGVLDEFDNNQQYGTAWINSARATKAIIETKRDVDYLIVLPHAGVEQVDVPLPEWRRRYQEFIDLGADAVVATHPHVPQGWEAYKGKPIFYSLGNFYFDAIEPADEWWYKGLMITLTVSNKGLEYTVHNTRFNSGMVEIDNSEETKVHNQYLLNLISDETAYMERINAIALERWEELQIYFIRGLGACSFHLSFKEFLKAVYCMIFRRPNRSLFINALQCESHRELVLRAMRLKEKE